MECIPAGARRSWGGKRAVRETGKTEEAEETEKAEKAEEKEETKETVLMYKLVTPMPVALTKEALREEVDICMGNAIAVCDRYADLLLKVLDGEMDKDAVMEAMGM